MRFFVVGFIWCPRRFSRFMVITHSFMMTFFKWRYLFTIFSTFRPSIKIQHAFNLQCKFMPRRENEKKKKRTCKKRIIYYCGMMFLVNKQCTKIRCKINLSPLFKYGWTIKQSFRQIAANFPCKCAYHLAILWFVFVAATVAATVTVRTLPTLSYIFTKCLFVWIYRIL